MCCLAKDFIQPQNLKSSIKGGIYSVKTRSSWQPLLCAVWPRGNQLGVHVKEGESVEGGRQGRQEAKHYFPREREQNLQRPWEREDWYIMQCPKVNVLFVLMVSLIHVCLMDDYDNM